MKNTLMVLSLTLNLVLVLAILYLGNPLEPRESAPLLPHLRNADSHAHPHESTPSPPPQPPVMFSMPKPDNELRYIVFSDRVRVKTDWSVIKGVFDSHPGQIYGVSQTHSRHVEVILIGGVGLTAVEPNLDDILKLAEGSPNTSIIQVTE